MQQQQSYTRGFLKASYVLPSSLLELNTYWEGFVARHNLFSEASSEEYGTVPG